MGRPLAWKEERKGEWAVRLIKALLLLLPRLFRARDKREGRRPSIRAHNTRCPNSSEEEENRRRDPLAKQQIGFFFSFEFSGAHFCKGAFLNRGEVGGQEREKGEIWTFPPRAPFFPPPSSSDGGGADADATVVIYGSPRCSPPLALKNPPDQFHAQLTHTGQSLLFLFHDSSH